MSPQAAVALRMMYSVDSVRSGRHESCTGSRNLCTADPDHVHVHKPRRSGKFAHLRAKLHRRSARSMPGSRRQRVFGRLFASAVEQSAAAFNAQCGSMQR